MNGRKQKLELTWIGKENRPKLEPRILLEELEKSYHARHRVTDKDVFDNQLIFGDNLLALKALEHEFSGRVKCVFIDPPYNTGSAFDHYDDGVEHSIWLSLMRDRLEIIRRLLSNEGSLWITIDDNEAHYLKILCDEVFGRINFVGNAVWQKKYTVANDAKWLSDNHDHVLIYALNKEIWRPYRLKRSIEMDKRYTNPDNHPKGPWKATPLYAKRTGSEKERKRPVNPIFTTSQVGGILHTKNMEERLCKDKTGKSMNFGEHILKIGSKVALARLTIAAGTTSGTTS